MQKQLELELDRRELVYVEVADSDVKSVKRNLARHKTMHKSYPLESDVTLFVFDAKNKLWLKGEQLTTENVREFTDRAAQTPKKKRVSGSRSTDDRNGFGTVENDDKGRGCIVRLSTTELRGYIQKLKDAGHIRQNELNCRDTDESDMAALMMYATKDAQNDFETWLRGDGHIVNRAEEQYPWDGSREAIDPGAVLAELKKHLSDYMVLNAHNILV